MDSNNNLPTSATAAERGEAQSNAFTSDFDNVSPCAADEAPPHYPYPAAAAAAISVGDGEEADGDGAYSIADLRLPEGPVGVDHVNWLLNACGISKGRAIESLKQCSSSLFALLFQRIFNCTIENLELEPNTQEKRLWNIRRVLEELQVFVATDLSYISAEHIVALREDDISELIRVFYEIVVDFVLNGHGGSGGNTVGAAAANNNNNNNNTSLAGHLLPDEDEDASEADSAHKTQRLVATWKMGVVHPFGGGRRTGTGTPTPTGSIASVPTTAPTTASNSNNTNNKKRGEEQPPLRSSTISDLYSRMKRIDGVLAPPAVNPYNNNNNNNNSMNMNTNARRLTAPRTTATRTATTENSMRSGAANDTNTGSRLPSGGRREGAKGEGRRAASAAASPHSNSRQRGASGGRASMRGANKERANNNGNTNNRVSLGFGGSTPRPRRSASARPTNPSAGGAVLCRTASAARVPKAGITARHHDPLACHGATEAGGHLFPPCTYSLAKTINTEARDIKIQQLKTMRFVADIQHVMRRDIVNRASADQASISGTIKGQQKAIRDDTRAMMAYARDENARYEAAYAAILMSCRNDVGRCRDLVDPKTVQIYDRNAKATRAAAAAVREAMQLQRDHSDRRVERYYNGITAWRKGTIACV